MKPEVWKQFSAKIAEIRCESESITQYGVPRFNLILSLVQNEKTHLALEFLCEEASKFHTIDSSDQIQSHKIITLLYEAVKILIDARIAEA